MFGFFGCVCVCLSVLCSLCKQHLREPGPPRRRSDMEKSLTTVLSYCRCIPCEYGIRRVMNHVRDAIDCSVRARQVAVRVWTVGLSFFS